MAKGAYSIVSYPESSDIDKIIETLVGAGAACKWILHDKFSDWELEQPSQHKPHYHIICGWETGFPSWKKFLVLCKSVGAVALSPSDCVVRDVDGIVDYLDHKDKPNKFQYSESDIQQTDDFAAELYATADSVREKQRAAKKQGKRDDLSTLFAAVMDTKLDEWCDVVDKIRSDNPQLFPLLFENAFPIKAYLDSLRASHKRKNAYDEEIRDLTNEIDKLRDLVKRLTEDNKLLSEDNERLRQNLVANASAFGDITPQMWEI